MKEIIVKEADTRETMNDFVALPRRLYAGNPYYVPDLDSDVRATFQRRMPDLNFPTSNPLWLIIPVESVLAVLPESSTVTPTRLGISKP